MNKVIFILALLAPIAISAQQTITLDACLESVSRNYPLAKQSSLLLDKNRIDIGLINKGKLPKIDLNAQASYQSEVTMLPIELPNIRVVPPNQDQYRTTLDVNQLIYGGGLINASVKVSQAAEAANQQALDVTLYSLKAQVNHLYLSVLLLQENQALLAAKEAQLLAKLKEVNAQIEYGALLPFASDALSVELLKIKQHSTELAYSKSALIERLSLLMDRSISSATKFERPSVYVANQSLSKRPELELFELRKTQLDFSSDVISKSRLPKINGFAQVGYGNPGLNMLDNSFNSFYIVGLKLNWNVFDWNTSRSQKQALEINKNVINTEMETFLLNNKLELTTILSDINKLKETIALDKEIIELRENLVQVADSQLKNGVISTSSYLAEFTNLYTAKSNLNMRKTQLLLKQLHYQITNGTYKNTQN
jgi:outer membrane protein TolC